MKSTGMPNTYTGRAAEPVAVSAAAGEASKATVAAAAALVANARASRNDAFDAV
jgi:hypothetical protein